VFEFTKLKVVATCVAATFFLKSKLFLNRIMLERVERVKGIEPSFQAWEAHVLPLNHTRVPNVVVLAHGDGGRKCFCG
jgi:hypothetical protein